MDSGKKQISVVQGEVISELHKHRLIPFTRFSFIQCKVCALHIEDYTESVNCTTFYSMVDVNIYGGYRCNELGCQEAVFHKECANPLQEINHSIHPDHPLKLFNPTIPLEDSDSHSLSHPLSHSEPHTCFCGKSFKIGYCCSICDFKLGLDCARRTEPLVVPQNPYGHEHPLKLARCNEKGWKICKECKMYVDMKVPHYRCQECEQLFIHMDCLDLFPDAYHTSHPQHPLKSLRGRVPDYADKKCLLCEKEFDQQHYQLHHCDVCNFSICRKCMRNPPPVDVESLKTHEHQLHLVPRLIDFTCNACGTQGNRSPYFCLECNFMIHRECIDLPRVININRHDHRISYALRLGHGEWKCKVCRQKVDGFYGAYTCSKCPTFAVHARCATNEKIWDMVEREGTPEEEETAPYEVIDDNTIRHFSHKHHNLQFNEDGMILSENTLCKACVFQIGAEPFYICKHQQCDFILHQKCANLPRKKRHVCSNLPLELDTNPHYKDLCSLCHQYFTGFRYSVSNRTEISNRTESIDVRCALILDSLDHESHPHTLYYCKPTSYNTRGCNRCENVKQNFFRCDECDDYILDGRCALLPKMVMKNRYDDHPLFLSYGDMNMDEKYWCEACETKVTAKEGFYTCNDCGVVLHISCLFGDFSYIMPGSFIRSIRNSGDTSFIIQGEVRSSSEEVVSNTSICRWLCYVCNSRCKLPSVLKVSKGEVVVYFCSLKCRKRFIK